MAIDFEFTKWNRCWVICREQYYPRVSLFMLIVFMKYFVRKCVWLSNSN